ncbi:ABC transporter permease [Pseudoflavitalea sp. X16]|uniref:ABC transporter permease n=1 Tax=Paraflavitalea devenefica TaxID=2716334 RepID=UPI00142464A8|nr:ABC transporter permease [Paraflavitalea devenefica]NII24209.1 ABC transporter permease [Paraflavitalea devenefica]
MFKTNLKTAFRNLWKNKTYNTLNILGLAIGIACAGLIFLWVEDEIDYDNVHVKKDRLYRINVNKRFDNRVFTMGSTPRPMAAALKSEVPGIVNTARASDVAQHALFSFSDKAMYASGRYVDAELFSMFTLNFVQGNAKNAFDQLHALVITESTAKKFFGEDKNVMGRTLRVDNEQDFVVTGVLKDLPENASFKFEWLAPFEFDLQRRQEPPSWESYGPYTYVELDPRANVIAVNEQLKNFISRKKSDQKSETFLFPMADWRLYNEFENGKQTGGGRIKQVRMLSTIAWIILFIACINFMNLATASSQRRAREVGVRKVLGAGKRGLIMQFIGETLLMSTMAAVVAMVIILISLPAYNGLMQKNLSLHPGNPLHITALLIITLICGLVAGSYPSMYLSSFNPVVVLKGLKMKAGSAALIRKGLVVLQFAVSVVFIISTIIVYSQLQHVKDRQLGFSKDNLIQVDMQHDVTGVFPLIKQDLLQTGLIENAALSNHSTIYGGNTDSRFKWQGKPVDNEVSIAHRGVSPEFISTFGMQIAEGRDFTVDGAAESKNVIITQSMASLMGKGSAVGKVIQSPRGNDEGVFTDLTVVGVVKDYVYGNMYGKPGPVIFFCQPKKAELVYARIKPNSDPEQLLTKIGAVMKKHNPAYPLEYKFVDDQFNEMFLNEVLISKASGVFATLAIIISCLGLFGLAAYTAERRTKEIGIRKVLGASVTGLAGLLSKDFLQLVIIACGVAFPVAWWIMHDWLQSYEYRIGISGWVFAAAGVGAVLIALLTVSTQAIKAALTNPVKSLRSE